MASFDYDVVTIGSGFGGSVAAPFRGVLPLTYEQFCYAFANAVSEEEAHQLDDDPDRGPLLIISGEQDHTVPWAIANASFQQQANPGVTEIVEIKGRGHALTIDSGWREVADTTLAFVQRFTLIGA
jgi:non-heme chloroperoxidase